ncbi:MAG: asparagine synthase (glutamine-hydrolyzing) [Opitutaceae bacterium]|nr:asparagine synthase (glutamine-hydrolyzing) [Cytophagales bacterium]
MCGIAGIASLRGENPNLKSWLKSMTNILRHRGPDDEGFTFFDDNQVECAGGKDTPANVYESRYPFSPQPETNNSKPTTALGHRRLSILDTSAAGHQPMCDLSRRYWIIFNGEIYNYKEVKAELLFLGHTFFSHCDTEVIIQSYIAWGKDCVLKFNGMWSFAIYDTTEKSFFCSRDRFGVKPFYYFISPEYFAFASEIKALVSLPFIEKKLNEKAVFDYLVLGQTELEPEGFFKNILELEPSHNLFLKDGKVIKEKYYTLPYNSKQEPFSEKKKVEYVDQVSFLIYDAVKQRLRSDVPVGACLSGGIDSSALVCTANNLRRGTEPFHVFTSVFPGSPVDESFWANKVVEATGTHWHTIETKPSQILEDYENLIYAQDIPFFGSSTLSQSNVMKLVHDNGIKVTLDGQGADELFSGYGQHFYVKGQYDLQKLNFKELLNLDNSGANSSREFTKFLAKRALKLLPGGIGSNLLKESKYDFQLLKGKFFNDNKNRLERGNSSITSNLNKHLYNEYSGPLLKYLMRTADRNSMRYSVESRAPFADDHKLAEYIFSIPSAYKIHEGTSKYLLRESMKGVIPEAIRQRKDKKGFATPELKWFKEYKNELKTLVTDNLEPFVDTKQLYKNWDQIFDQKITGNTLGISRFVILSMWRRKFQL